jgi:hypothetical protein
LPVGLIFRIRVKPLAKKYFAFTEIEIALYAALSCSLEGRIAIVTTRGAGCGGRVGAQDERD